MSIDYRLSDYMAHIFEALYEIFEFTEGQTKDDFLEDRRTQKAVAADITIIGEASKNIAHKYPEFIEAHPEIPWREMRAMRNRIAHGYFDINFEIVWSAVQENLPELLCKLENIKKECEAKKPSP